MLISITWLLLRVYAQILSIPQDWATTDDDAPQLLWVCGCPDGHFDVSHCLISREGSV